MNNDFSSSAGDFVQDFGNAVRENPVSAALIGMGLVWLLTGAGNPLTRAQSIARRAGIDRLPDAAADAFNSGRDALSSGFDAVTERASSLAGRASEGAQKLGDIGASATGSLGDTGAAALRSVSRVTSDFAGTATDTFRGIPDRGGELYSSARDNLTDLFARQPLFLGAVGIAIGAGIAASLPSTDFEAGLLGETADEFKQTASRFVSEQKENVTGIASGIATAVQEEAKAQGLTVDGLQDAANDTLHKLQNVATAASDSVKDRLSGGKAAGAKSP
jgi:hypothetical protein